jgi:hypothetical protein
LFKALNISIPQAWSTETSELCVILSPILNHKIPNNKSQFNVLIDDNWHVRIADFEMNLISEMDAAFLTTGRGSPRWMAPELLRLESSELPGMRRMKASDIYALGCTLLEVRICRLCRVFFSSSFLLMAI